MAERAETETLVDANDRRDEISGDLNGAGPSGPLTATRLDIVNEDGQPVIELNGDGPDGAALNVNRPDGSVAMRWSANRFTCYRRDGSEAVIIATDFDLLGDDLANALMDAIGAPKGSDAASKAARSRGDSMVWLSNRSGTENVVILGMPDGISLEFLCKTGPGISIRWSSRAFRVQTSDGKQVLYEHLMPAVSTDTAPDSSTTDR